MTALPNGENMRDQMQQRLDELQTELETGKRALAELDARRADLTQTMFRIGGAIQVIQELLAVDEQSAGKTSRMAHPPVQRVVNR